MPSRFSGRPPFTSDRRRGAARWRRGCRPGRSRCRAGLPTVSGDDIRLRIAHHMLAVDGKPSACYRYQRHRAGAADPASRRPDRAAACHQRARRRQFDPLARPAGAVRHGRRAGAELSWHRAGRDLYLRISGRQTGTYWYHSHSNLQEQMGHYGPIVIDPAGADPVDYDREHVVVLSDHSPLHPHEIFRKLKLMGGYFNYRKQTPRVADPHLRRGTGRFEAMGAVRRTGLWDRVELPGPTSDMAWEWTRASLSALTSQPGEGFPLVIQEAMAAGVPVIAYDMPTGPRDQIDQASTACWWRRAPRPGSPAHPAARHRRRRAPPHGSRRPRQGGHLGQRVDHPALGRSSTTPSAPRSRTGSERDPRPGPSDHPADPPGRRAPGSRGRGGPARAGAHRAARGRHGSRHDGRGRWFVVPRCATCRPPSC